MIKEPTASTFIFHREADGTWRTALIWHPRLHCWLPAGGHVETDESTAQAAVRESREETGLDVTLVPGPAVPLPAGFPHRPVPAPWWVTETPAAPDRHTSEPHVHIDHIFLATAATTRPTGTAEHQVRWLAEDDIATAADISQDSRLQAAELLARIAGRRLPLIPAPAGTADRDRTRSADRTGRGSPPTLVLIRGNSASGKTAAAAELRRRHGRGLAIVAQDNLRRVILRERDAPDGANIALIDLTARHALGRGYHVIVEGILRADHYGQMLATLISDHAGNARAYYLDVPFAETLRRHAAKPQAAEYGEAEMRTWYRERDLLPGGIEHIVPAESSLAETVARIMADTGLTAAPEASR